MQRILHTLIDAGAAAVSVVAISSRGVEPKVRQAYERWIADGCHAGMTYMERNAAIRFDPRELLPGAVSMVCCAWPYMVKGDMPGVARFARGLDYHDTIRRRMEPVQRLVESLSPGAETRVCVDSAPVTERYWAARSGIGTLGLSGLLAVPGCGTRVILSELLSTSFIEPSEPLFSHTGAGMPRCDNCGKCVRFCPSQALRGDGTLDARRCLAYLTVEHRGDFETGTRLHGRVFGCDTCQDVCPMNRDVTDDGLPEFSPTLNPDCLDADKLTAMTSSHFNKLTKGTSLRRAGRDNLLRNLRNK